MRVIIRRAALAAAVLAACAACWAGFVWLGSAGNMFTVKM